METVIPQDEPSNQDVWAFLDELVFPVDGKEVSKSLFELGFSTLNMKRRVSARIRKFIHNTIDHTKPFWYIDIMVNCADKYFEVTYETNFSQSKLISRQAFKEISELIAVLKQNHAINWVIAMPETEVPTRLVTIRTEGLSVVTVEETD